MPTTLVTGANRGIGLELCRALKEGGQTVVAVCRKPTPELERLGVRVEAGVDVTSSEGLAELATRLGDVKLDCVIANAGILRGDSLESLEWETVQEQLEVNALGPLRTVKALLPNLAQGGKVALITSRMGSIADNSSGGYYGYRMSKAALNAAGVSLARDLAPLKIAVAILHPGYVRTDMTGKHGNVSPEEAAKQLLARVDALTLKSSGTFWHANGEVLPW
jgi:NAD(P)-dependent dehydrogenase (short-subunit alcohol dehydrogenase family)